MDEDLDLYDNDGNLFSAWPFEKYLRVGVYNDYGHTVFLTRVQALRLAEYIGEVFGD